MSKKTIEWIKYSKQQPAYGDMVIIYREIESRQMYVTKWTEEEARYADWNEITHWAYINYPNNV